MRGRGEEGLDIQARARIPRWDSPRGMSRPRKNFMLLLMMIMDAPVVKPDKAGLGMRAVTIPGGCVRGRVRV